MDSSGLLSAVQSADIQGYSAAYRLAIDGDAWGHKGYRACGNNDVLSCDSAAHIYPPCRA